MRIECFETEKTTKDQSDQTNANSHYVTRVLIYMLCLQVIVLLAPNYSSFFTTDAIIY